MICRATGRYLLAGCALSMAFGLVWGCAEGGSGGPGRLDSGTRIDAFVPDTDSGPGDSGAPPVDSGFDAGHDAGPTIMVDSGSGRPDAGCTSSADCDDGLACNGTERCEGGRCTGGIVVSCDDGIACTMDLCEEPGGSCNFVPDDTACGSGESCSPATGCVAGCGESPCKLVAPQCGCPSGQGCYIDGTGSRLCTTAGANGAGNACSGLSSCVPGHLCININSEGGSTAVCAEFCNLDSDCDSGGLCVITLDDGSGGSLPGIKLCTNACDPVAQTGCRSGAYCDVFRESAGAMRYFTDCTAPAAGTGTQGTACASPDDCQSGFACIDPDGSTGAMPQQCMHWCNRSTGSGCAAGETCFGFDPALDAGGTEYGVCG